MPNDLAMPSIQRGGPSISPKVPMGVSSNTTFPFFFFFNDTATTEIYTLSLHDALPISAITETIRCRAMWPVRSIQCEPRSEEHTSELQSQFHLVCRLLLEKKNK